MVCEFWLVFDLFFFHIQIRCLFLCCLVCFVSHVGTGVVHGQQSIPNLDHDRDGGNFANTIGIDVVVQSPGNPEPSNKED